IRRRGPACLVLLHERRMARDGAHNPVTCGSPPAMSHLTCGRGVLSRPATESTRLCSAASRRSPIHTRESDFHVRIIYLSIALRTTTYLCLLQGFLPWVDALPTGHAVSLPTASARYLPSRYSLAATPQGGGCAQTSARIRHRCPRVRVCLDRGRLFRPWPRRPSGRRRVIEARAGSCSRRSQ